ncbi:MAG: sec-independent translocase [Jatrophihabitantaceae bacterium]
MFNIGPLEFVVLALVAVIVIGPDKLPALAKDAARMLKTLRELATGARTQLRDELGPEFADMDLRSLNPRTALQRAILGDEESGLRSDLRKFDPREELRDLDPRQAMRDAVRQDDDPSVRPEQPISMRKPEQRPLARGEAAPYDEDAT